jgi:anti-sigma-K factor RskA
MSGAADHDRVQENVGAYILGALGEAEDAAFERHLATCHVCQDEVERLTIAARALPRSVEQYDPPPSLKRALMEQVYADAEPTRSERRSLAERLGLAGRFAGLTPRLAAAAACILALGAIAGYAIKGTGGGGGGTSHTLSAAVDSSRVGAGRASLVVHPGGSELRVSSMPQPRGGQVYEVWVERRGQIQPAALFSVDQNGRGVGAVPGSLDGVTRVMVTRERRGGARQPTEAPVVTAKV